MTELMESIKGGTVAHNEILGSIKKVKLSISIWAVFFLCFSPAYFASNRCAAQSTPQHALLALSKTDHTLAIVDPTTLKVIVRLPVGQDPHEVVASSDGKTAYVSIYGGGRFHELSVIDLVAQKALPSIDTRPLIGPHGLVFVGGKVWFTAEGSKAVGSYDPTSAKLDWSMGTGQNRTHMLYVTQDTKKIYTTNVDAGSVSFLEDVLLPPPMSPTGAVIPGAQSRMEWLQTIIPVSKGSEGFDVSPDGRELWTASAQDGTIAIIDTATRKVKTTIDAKVLGANRLKFTPDGKRAFIDLKTLEVTGHVDVGKNPDGLAWAVR
jgi:YVTN family beta-propeller protein